MNNRHKQLENKLRAEGFTKLRLKDNIESTRPHDFRYMHPHGNESNRWVSIISQGALYGVYGGSGWGNKYEIVDWETPDCSCLMCEMNDGGDETLIISRGFADAIRNMDSLSKDDIIDMYGFTVEKKDGEWKEVSFMYKVNNESNS